MSPVPSYTVARLPRLVFGAGSVAAVPAEIAALGGKALIVTGARSFRDSEAWPALQEGLEQRGVSWETLSVASEPSPELVDQAVAEFRGLGIKVVLGIGGGSALDAAKAIAGLLPHGNSVMDHLEGVGPELVYKGPSLPFVAVPTTAGTGSEATKNAVLSRSGADGFKKSFRDEKLVAQVAVVDPDLLASCPPPVLAANGMDALTQLIESYVSLKAGPVTDALALSGLEAFRQGFFAAWEGEGEAAGAGRAAIAHASLMSGICLAQAGLGAVHGLAPPLGSLFPIGHGIACGTVVAEATDVNIRALSARAAGGPALAKYARVAEVLAGRPDPDALVALLRDWTARLGLPRLSAFGVGAADVARIVAGSRGSSMKTNPVVLSDDEVAEIVMRRL
jgi:alcohol dehydrogenase